MISPFHKAKKRSGTGWGARVFVVFCFLLLGWFWWQKGPEPLEDRPLPEARVDAPPVEASTPARPQPAPRDPFTNVVIRPSSPASGPASQPDLLSQEAGLLPRTPSGGFEIQVALARNGFSPGPIDGIIGSQTRSALRAFQKRWSLPPTGVASAATLEKLMLYQEPLMNYQVTPADKQRLRRLGVSWFDRSQQDRLEYETVLEYLAELSQCHPQFLRSLNPSVPWEVVTAGTTVRIPHVKPPAPNGRAAFVRIFLADRVLQVFDGQTNIIAHFPCSIAQKAEKRPVGKLEVWDIVPNPNYVFNPENFPDSPEARLGRMVLPPGPNNPVGTVWVTLSKPGYGIHGTPRPEEVGRTGSLGCFRLANWNAEHLLKLVWIGMAVYIDP